MKNQFKRIYIASPYSHSNSTIRSLRFRQVTELAAKLFNKYEYVFLLPITQGHMLTRHGDIEANFDRWRTQSLGMLSVCQELWVIKLDGWKQSLGVREEIKYARKHLIPIKYIDPKKIK